MIKHLQLNTSTLRSPKEVASFIKTNEIDIACLNEIVYPIGEVSPLKKLVEADGNNYLEGVDYRYLPNNQIVAEAIVSKLPITYYENYFYNSANYEPKEIKKEEILGELVNDNASLNFPGSRGIKHAIKPRCIINALIQTPEGLLRVLTTHYSVSDMCTETIQMYEMSKLITSLIKYSKQMPTIFSGDLNIRAGSFSVVKLSEELTCLTKDLKDTLSKNHPAKKKDFPEGLAIDHVFSKNLKHKETNTIEVGFSDHQAIVSLFDF